MKFWVNHSCFKLKGSSSKATYAAKNAPPFCEIWFVCKGRHVWTREASEGTYSFLSVFSPDAAVLNKDYCEPMPYPEHVSSNTFMTADLQGDGGKSKHAGQVVSTDFSVVNSTNLSNSRCPLSLLNTLSCPASPVAIGFSPEINSQVCLKMIFSAICCFENISGTVVHVDSTTG